MTISAQPRGYQFLFDSEGLPTPSLPHHLVDLLLPIGDTVFSTKGLPSSLYDLHFYVSEFDANEQVSPYAAVGFAGHGVNSWAAHCYIVNDGLALFLQLAWGGIYLDADAAKAKITKAFDWAAQLQAKLDQARRLKKIPSGRWLEVIESDFSMTAWRWIDNLSDKMTPQWREESAMSSTLLPRLDDSIANSGH